MKWSNRSIIWDRWSNSRNNHQKQCIPCVCTQMSRQNSHPTFAHNVYTSLQMSQDVYIHLPSRMTLRQLRETLGVTTLSKWNDKLWDSLSYFHKDLKRFCIIWTLKNKFKWGMVATQWPIKKAVQSVKHLVAYSLWSHL